MGRFSQIHAESAPRRAEDAETEVRWLRAALAIVMPFVPSEADEAWRAETFNQGASDYCLASEA